MCAALALLQLPVSTAPKWEPGVFMLFQCKLKAAPGGTLEEMGAGGRRRRRRGSIREMDHLGPAQQGLSLRPPPDH